MNYLTEINRFYGWLTTHPLSPQAQALWNLLMSINNRAGWPKEFSVPSGTLAATLGVSRTQLSRCRKELIDGRRITHTRRKGGQPPLYQVLALEAEKTAKGELGEAEPEPVAPPKVKRGPTGPQRLNPTNLHLVR